MFPSRHPEPFRPTFVADWVNVAFIHYAVPPDVLQPGVPFELDTFEGTAYISLVAFTQRRLRPTIGGRIAEVLSTPLACHEFLNVRTYVRTGDERGIYFLAEWIPNRLAALVGPALYGLPYRVGQLRYAHHMEQRIFTADVKAREGRLKFCGSFTPEFDEAEDESLDAFLLERYTAWTHRAGVARRFRIQHEPWNFDRAAVTIDRADLLMHVPCEIAPHNPTAAHFSPGLHDVAIGPPQRCHSPHRNVTGICTSGCRLLCTGHE